MLRLFPFAILWTDFIKNNIYDTCFKDVPNLPTQVREFFSSCNSNKRNFLWLGSEEQDFIKRLLINYRIYKKGGELRAENSSEQES